MVLNRIIVVTLSLLLCVSLLGANAALALDRGALNEEYVKQTAAENGLYEAVEQEAVTTVRQEAPDTEELPVDVDVGSLVASALTPEYIRNQSEANIDRVYAFLRDEGELEIVLDTRPLKENVVDALVEEVRETDMADLAGEGEAADRLANLTESEESYEAERERVREQIKAEIKNATGIHPEDDFGSDVLANLAESEESYEAERAAFEEARKQEIQNSTQRHMSDEELERAYEDQLPEIRDRMRSLLEEEYLTEDTPASLEEPFADLIDLTVDALTTDMTYDEFDAEYATVKADVDDGLDRLIEERSDEFADEIRSEMAGELEGSDMPAPFEEGARETVDLVLRAVTSDMSYEEFTTELESIKVTMAEEGGQYILDEHEGGVPDRVVVTEELDESDVQELEPVKQAVSTIELLAWVLPLVSLGLIGGIYGVSRRGDTVALAVGVVALVVGGLSAAAARIVPARAVEFIELDVTDALLEAIRGIVQGLFAPLWTQSVGLFALGVVLLGAGIALRYELGPFARAEPIERTSD